MTHDLLVAAVRGLQLATFVTWGAVVLIRGGSLWSVLFRGSRSKWDRQWSSIVLMAITQGGFSARWLVFGGTMDRMSAVELLTWGPLYLSSCMSAVGIAVEHGWWTDDRHRLAMGLHVGVILLSVAAAWSVS